MAVALVTHIATSGSTSGGTSSGVDTTGASLLVFSITQQGTDVTVSDNKSNSWAGLTVYGGSPKCRIFYVANPTVGTGHTFTVSGVNTFSMGFVAAFSGIKTTAPFESQNGVANAPGTTIQAGSVTPAENGALIVAAVAGGSGFLSTVTIGSGFTKTDSSAYVASTTYGGALAYLVQPTAGAINPTWTPGASVAMTATNAVFAPAVVATAAQARVLVMA